MNLDGSGKRVLTAGFDRAVDNPHWSADGRSIYVQYDEHGSNRVARVGLDGSVRDVATGLTAGALDRPYSGGEFSVSRNGLVTVTAGDNLHPSDVGVASGGAVRHLTHLNQQLQAKVLGQPQKLAVASSVDRRPIDAWMITPPDFDGRLTGRPFRPTTSSMPLPAMWSSTPIRAARRPMGRSSRRSSSKIIRATTTTT